MGHCRTRKTPMSSWIFHKKITFLQYLSEHDKYIFSENVQLGACGIRQKPLGSNHIAFIPATRNLLAKYWKSLGAAFKETFFQYHIVSKSDVIIFFRQNSTLNSTLSCFSHSLASAIPILWSKRQMFWTFDKLQFSLELA